MRRAANVAERRSDKMNVFIFLITGIYLSVMAVIDHRLQKIPVLPGMIGILVIVLASCLLYTSPSPRDTR